jgi:hypothetical protein
MVLPLFDVLGCPRGEVGARGLGEAVMLVFKHGDSSLWVESSSPRAELPQDYARQRAVSNFAWRYANRAPNTPGPDTAPEAERVIRLGAESTWQSADVTVDDSPTPFDTFFVEDNWWVAVGAMPDVALTISSFGLPFQEVVLAQRR